MSKTIKVHLALFAVSLLYGATYAMAKAVMPMYIKPFGFIVLRVSSALLLFLVFHALFVRQRVDKKDLIPLAISAFFGSAANMLLFFAGLEITTPIHASVLMLVTPVFVLLISLLTGAEKPSVQKIGGVMLSAMGALFLMGGIRLSFSADTLLGDVFIILNAISFAIYLVYVKKLMVKYNPFTVSRWNFIFGFIYVLPFGFGQLSDIEWASFTGEIWFYVVFICVGTTFLTYLLNAYALQHTGSSLVGTYIYLQPVVAGIIAVSKGMESLTVMKVIFILLIFAGVYLVSKKHKTKV
jgi:drug/metabolite transporter (DMT)-like permease